EGVLRELYPRAQVFVRFSRLKPKHELGAWVRHLALACTGGESEQTVVMGRSDKDRGSPIAVRVFRPVSVADAKKYVSRLLELYQLGQKAPLCLFPSASATFAAAFLKEATKGGSPDRRIPLEIARKAFDGGRGFGDGDDAYVKRLFEGEDPFSEES